MALSKYDIEVDLTNRQGTSHALLVEMAGANKRILDVGCDTGYLGEALATFGNYTAGFEANAATAELARSRLDRVEVGDLESTDLVEMFGRDSFDVVIFGDVLEHLRDPLPVLRQARPLLAPGGSVLISTPNVAHGDVRLALLSGRFNYTKLGILDETHTRFFTRDSLVDFLHAAGFVLIELRRTRADLFTTEIGVTESDFEPALVATLRQDVEATTYQFVARAVPDDAASVESSLALRLDQTQGELEAERARSAGLRSEGKELRGAIAALQDRLAEVQASHDEAVRQRDEAIAERAATAARADQVNSELAGALRQRSLFRRALDRVRR